MTSPEMDDAEPKLTDADRRAIAEIRRRLDAEFRAKLDAEFGPVEDRPQEKTRRRRLRRSARERAGPRGVVVTLILGMLTGMVLGATGIVVWDRYAQRESVLSAARAPAQDVESRNDSPGTPWAAVDEVALLRDALEDWIEATRRGDIAAQMRFYPERVPVYYTWRNVPREAVRAEKVKVFGAATRLDITTDVPGVELAQDGLTAVTRFRKRYVIEGPVIRRRGEVLQELSWTRTTAGWLIVGERDARVLRSRSS